MNKKTYSFDLAGTPLTLEIGRLAQQATSSVLARLGDTMVLITVVEGSVREDLGYFPLSVEYIERLYAGGRIKGSRWVKREGRPSDDGILTARLIDRSIRPLFPKEYKNEVQIVVTQLSVDGENEPDILSVIGVSVALAISQIPWNGPIGAVRMGLVEDKVTGAFEFLINPGSQDTEFSKLDLILSQTSEKTVMMEAGALQVPEEVVLEAIKKGHVVTKEVISFIQKIVQEIGEKKTEVRFDSTFKEIVTQIEKSYKSELIPLIKARATKENLGEDTETLIDRIFDDLKMQDPEKEFDKKFVSKAFEYVLFKLIKEQILKKQERPDGRKIDEIRPLALEVSVLPRTHGSALFQRGSTQSLTVVTLGSPRLEQLIESAEGEESKRYIHHYSMPPYSVGETGRIGVPSRREIGHGALAERAILGVIPSREKFPYTIRVVSEILSSNGSTSMAATCGSTLALMDAGVPIVKPVAGIAMGLMSSEEKYVILTDIIGLEDFSGDMDFKVAGTEDGVTAIQLDVKIPGLTTDQIKETFEGAKKARLFILEKMHQTIGFSRTQVSEYAPKIEVVRIAVDKIGEVIGPGGRIIRSIIAETGASVDVEDDGTITISGISEESVQKAVDKVTGLTREVSVGEEFEGPVKRILPFGAFVEILPGKEGMVHVSQMASEFVKNPSDVVQIGQTVKVRVLEVDEQGRINLSMLFGSEAQEKNRMAERSGNDRGIRNEHPLALQFKRERAHAMRRSGSGPRFRSKGPRKAHY